MSALVSMAGCGGQSAPPAQNAAPQNAQAAAALPPVHDPHTHANPDQIRVQHLDLVLAVDFDSKRMNGTADLQVKRIDPKATELVLDTADLDIDEVSLVKDGATQPLEHTLGAADPITGSALTIKAPEGDTFTVRVKYRTRPEASGLQWLDPPQTAGKKYPFLFTQSEAIHARSWVPVQDTPHVRMTYTATIRVPKGLTAVMAAAPLEKSSEQGALSEFRFKMPQAIPSYLLALGVGDLEFRKLGPRTGVYAERPLAEAAAREFADTESMLVACEKLFGPYRWERYDLLILPPSFPFGGMENPRLSFITPTVIAGDKSLTAVIAHELAHSWSGNLVTNATWRDLWLNEGFTVFLERRILETLYGEKRRQMEELLGLQSLQKDFADLKPADQVLALDLTGRDPDDVFSQVPYEKGYLFLRYLESKVGRQAFDEFLHGYFDHFAFQSITTEQFLDYLHEHLPLADTQQLSASNIEEWVHGSGLPADAVLPSPDAFAHVDAARTAWLEGKKKAAQLDTRAWSTHEWLHFLDNMPAKLRKAQLDDLDRTFHFNNSRNAEIANSWLLLAIHNQYEPAVPRLEEYLVTIGRRKLVKPLYTDLEKTEWGKALATRIYAKARPGYHVQTRTLVDPIVLGKPPAAAANPS